MEWSDVKTAKELVGQLVAYESGSSYGGSKEEVATIIHARTKFFQIDKSSDNFSPEKGEYIRKQGEGMMNMGKVSRCRLISKEEAADLLQKQARRELAKTKRNYIQEFVNKKDMTYKQINFIYNYLTNGDEKEVGSQEG